MDNIKKELEETPGLEEKYKQLRTENHKLKAKLKRRIEFSKIIFVGVSAVTLAITGFSCYMIWLTMDTSALAYLIPAVAAEMATSTGFYYNKAKAENKIKLMDRYGVKPEAQNFDNLN